MAEQKSTEAPRREARGGEAREARSEEPEVKTGADESKKAAADVSNADVDLTRYSRDADHANYEEDPNLDKDQYPVPGLHTVQVLGEPQEKGEEFEKKVRSQK